MYVIGQDGRDAEQAGNLHPAYSLVDHAARDADFIRREFRLAAHMPPAIPRRRHARLGPLRYHVALLEGTGEQVLQSFRDAHKGGRFPGAGSPYQVWPRLAHALVDNAPAPFVRPRELKKVAQTNVT